MYKCIRYTHISYIYMWSGSGMPCYKIRSALKMCLCSLSSAPAGPMTHQIRRVSSDVSGVGVTGHRSRSVSLVTSSVVPWPCHSEDVSHAHFTLSSAQWFDAGLIIKTPSLCTPWTRHTTAIWPRRSSLATPRPPRLLTPPSSSQRQCSPSPPQLPATTTR